jgi:hypothetical protein
MSLFDNKEKSVKEFAFLITKMEPKEFLSLAGNVLKVKLFHDASDGIDEVIPRTSESIIEDCLVKFYGLSRQNRRLILKAAKASIKASKRGRKNG